MSEKLYNNNNNNNVSLNEREAGKRETEIKTIVNAGLSKCALSEPIMGPAAGDSIKKAKWKKKLLLVKLLGLGSTTLVHSNWLNWTH